jgi:hypothetical protein
LLGENSLSEKEQKSEGWQNVHQQLLLGLKRRASNNSNPSGQTRHERWKQ